MAKKPNIKSLSMMRFNKLKENRAKIISSAPASAIPKEFPVNVLSQELHPEKQYVTISAIKIWDENCKSYTFTADESKGTKHLAYFKAGSYLSVFLDVQGIKLTRPYSISSSPKEALEGSYTLTIKRVPDGIASNYILDNWKIGDSVTLSGPLGEFVYLPVREAKTVIALAGGSGITPFHSMAQAIADGDESCNLILLYGSRTEKDILFHEDFDRLDQNCDKIKVIHVLSHEEKEGYEHGFINADIIQKYAPDEAYSVFLCGPSGMYRFMDKELEKFHLERKWIRRELQGEFHNPKEAEDYPAGPVPESVTIHVTVCGKSHTIQASTNDSILRSLEKNEIAAPSRCRSGECGWCHTRLIKGKIFSPKSIEHRREADFLYGYIHLCCSFPLTDIDIDVPNAK